MVRRIKAALASRRSLSGMSNVLLVLEIEEADKRLDENLGSLVAYDFSEGSPLVPRPSESIHTWSVRQAACLAKLKIDSAATGARRRAGPFLVDRI